MNIKKNNYYTNKQTKNEILCFVDVGCANKLCNIINKFKINEYNLIGFDPEEEGFNNLKKNIKTINQLYLFGLYNNNINKKLYITKKKELSSLLKPNYDNVIKYELKEYLTNWNIIEEVDIPVKKLCEITMNIPKIDYLKLDTQGTEYEILLGLENDINKVKIIKIELEFIELYENQKLFGDVHKYLIDNNFILAYFDRIVSFSKECKSENYKKNKQFLNNKRNKYKLYIKKDCEYYKRLKWNINKRLNIITELINYDIFEKKDVIKKINEIHEIDKIINDTQDYLLENNKHSGTDYIEIERNINTIFGDAIYVNKNISYSNSNKYNNLLNKLFTELHLPHNIIKNYII